MLIKTKGIVLRNVKYGESSLILDMYTEDNGLISLIIGGIRKQRAKTPASIFQVMTWLEIVLYYRERSNLNRIKEARPLFLYNTIPFDIRKKGVALFITEVLQKTLKEKVGDTSLFNFIFNMFYFLDRTNHTIANLIPYFLLKLSGFLGFQPYGKWSKNTPYFHLLHGQFQAGIEPALTLDAGESKYLAELNQLGLEECHNLIVPAEIRKELVVALIAFYKFHLEKFREPRTTKIFSEIIN